MNENQCTAIIVCFCVGAIVFLSTTCFRFEQHKLNRIHEQTKICIKDPNCKVKELPLVRRCP